MRECVPAKDQSTLFLKYHMPKKHFLSWTQDSEWFGEFHSTLVYHGYRFHFIIFDVKCLKMVSKSKFM